jgi:CBS domain-containing protein
MADPHVETIAAFVRTPELTLDVLDTMRIARRRMEADSLRSLAVTHGERFVGVLNWQAIRGLSGRDLEATVARYVETDVPKLTRNTTIAEAVEAFRRSRVTTLGLLPVLDSAGQLEGTLERERFLGNVVDSSGRIFVPEDPIADLLAGPELPKVGAKVVSSNGRKLGTFQGYIDDRGQPRWIDVRHGPFWKRRNRRVTLAAIDRQSADEIVLHIDVATWATFRDSPKR